MNSSVQTTPTLPVVFPAISDQHFQYDLFLSPKDHNLWPPGSKIIFVYRDTGGFYVDSSTYAPCRCPHCVG